MLLTFACILVHTHSRHISTRLGLPVLQTCSLRTPFNSSTLKTLVSSVLRNSARLKKVLGPRDHFTTRVYTATATLASHPCPHRFQNLLLFLLHHIHSGTPSII